MVYHRILSIVSCAMNRTLLFIHSKCTSLHLPTPNSQFILLPPTLSPLANTSLFSMSVNWFLFYKQVNLYSILDSTYKGYHMASVFLFLTYFIQYDNFQLPPCCCKQHYFIFFHGWVVFHYRYVPNLFYPFIC